VPGVGHHQLDGLGTGSGPSALGDTRRSSARGAPQPVWPPTIWQRCGAFLLRLVGGRRDTIHTSTRRGLGGSRGARSASPLAGLIAIGKVVRTSAAATCRRRRS
jgi:hypothetical protein